MIITKRLTKETPLIFNSVKEKLININTISLESAEDNLPIDIYCSNKKKKETFKICSLKKNVNEIYSTSLMLNLHNINDKYEFYLKTKSNKVIVNIIGFSEEEEDQEELEEDKQKKKSSKKEKKKKSDDESNSESDSEDDNLENDLDSNKPEVSLVELLNKKRKEEPQDIKPITLKNLEEKKKEGNNIIKKDNKNKNINDNIKEKKDKIKENKFKGNQGNKLNPKDNKINKNK